MFLRFTTASRRIAKGNRQGINRTISTKNEGKVIGSWNNADRKNKSSFLWKDFNDVNQGLTNADIASYETLPLCTRMGIEILCAREGYEDVIDPVLELLCTIGCSGHTRKASISIPVTTEEVVRSNISKLISLLFDKSPTQQAINTLFTSFLIRMRQTVTLLVSLGLEKDSMLNEKLESSDIEELFGLTLLYTAYTSRHLRDGILLASGMTLKREYCPDEGLIIFDTIMNLKGMINKALREANDYCESHITFLYAQNGEKAESRAFCDWIKLVKDGKEITPINRPNVNDKQRPIVNDIILEINKLRELPKSPGTIAQLKPRM